MDFKIYTHKGISIDIKGGPSLLDFCAQLNNRNLRTLPLGGMVESKNIFKTITPAGELTGQYEVHTSDGNVYLTDIEGYDEFEISKLTNDPQNLFVLIGNIILQQQNVEIIKPVAA